jgi:hypothetical protein
MIRLLKFEIQKKWKMSLGALLGYFLIYFGFLFKFRNDGLVSFEQMPFRLVFFILLASGLFFLAGIAAINSLRVEAKQSSRDLYFSLPLSAYTKIGSKVIVATVEATAAAVIGTLTCLRALEYLTGFAVMKQVFEGIKEVAFVDLVASFYFQLVLGILMLLIIYLSFAIFRSFFSQVRFGGMITMVIYVLLMYLNIRYVFPLMSFTEFSLSSEWFKLLLLTSYTGIVFTTVGYLFEKRANFD